MNRAMPRTSQKVAWRSYLTHFTSAPSATKLSTNPGWARRIGSASRIVDSPSTEEATISSAIATRMM